MRLLHSRLSPTAILYYKSDRKSRYPSPVCTAVTTGNSRSLRILIEEFGFNVNKKDLNSSTPLEDAVVSPQSTVEIVAFLLDNGADVNPTCSRYIYGIGSTKVRITDFPIKRGDEEVLSMLLQKGAILANPKAKHLELTVLTHWWCRVVRDTAHIMTRLCRVLVNHSRSKAVSESIRQNTTVYLQSSLESVIKRTSIASSYRRVRGVEGCKILLEAGVSPNTHNNLALQYAVKRVDENCVDFVRILMQHGANPFLFGKY